MKLSAVATILLILTVPVLAAEQPLRKKDRIWSTDAVNGICRMALSWTASRCDA